MTEELKIPEHVAIILDGNGRWATERGLSRSMGHKQGAETLKSTSLYIFNRGVKQLSVFAFSRENFKRSEEEVNYLMNLFIKLFNRELKSFKEYNIKIVFSGTKENLNDKVVEAMNKIEELTKDNEDHILNICLNYSGDYEIVDAAKKFAKDVLENKIAIEDLDTSNFYNYLYQPLKPIDLMIRTSGELRISNFMLYQLSYAEMSFPKTYFPDFDGEEFEKCLLEYNSRDRRFGGINNETKGN